MTLEIASFKNSSTRQSSKTVLTLTCVFYGFVYTIRGGHIKLAPTSFPAPVLSAYLQPMN
jgi:hypothetical protein